MPLTLRRFVETVHGTFGQFTLADGTNLYSVERQSVGEHPRIPAGLYEITLDTYHHGGYPAYLVHVPGRDRILIHAANRAVELLGCIAPGKALGFIAEQLAVLDSKKALTILMASLDGAAQDYLTIHDPQEG